jgi:hypothetical protein
MKKLTAVLVCLGLCFLGFGQHANLKGNILDTFNNKKLSNTVVAVLQAKDSILYKFTRSDASGKFELKNLRAGKYLLLVTSPSYADFVDQLNITDSSSELKHDIILSLKARLLQDVVVRQTVSAIKLKGDTTEYAADSFKVQPNASVEDLLKKLPGIQVDKNGQITAQGEKVQKVLVDGEEFFGDDPTLVTQNLRADMVDKVQVFDKKSDQAAFTGIDDGQKTKTLNLKLKDNKKNGYFGKINAGAGTNGYHDSQAMINMFKKKQKLSAYGILSNTGKTGLNWQERDSYGQSDAENISYDETSGYYYSSSQGDELDSWNGQYNGQGFPLVQTGGLHYNNKWNDDKQSVNGNYKILQLHVDGSSATNSQYILPDTLYYTNSRQSFANKILRHRANGNYEIQLDSSSSIKISADGGTDHKITNSANMQQSLAQDSSLVNENQRDISTIGDMHTVNSNVLWKKKLKKKGRTLSFNLTERYNKNNSTGYLNSLTNFYKEGNIDSIQRIDQYKTNLSENILFDTKLTYSEPLSATSSLIFNYGIVVNNSNSNRNSFNKNNDGKYSQLDTVYSNDYAFNVFTHRGGVSYSLVKKKLRLNFGGNVGFTNFDQKDMRRNIEQKRNFVNWYPQANMTYSFTNMRRLGINYTGNTSQPRIDQIQPLRTNDDPLNIVVGNPDLKPQFQNTVRLYFNDYKVLSERGIFLNANYGFTQNAISSKTTVDATGKRTNQAVNVDGNRFASIYFNYGFKWKKPDLRVGANANFNTNRYVNYVNEALNVTNSGNYSLGVYIGKYKEKKFDISLNTNATYTNSKSSVQQNIKTNYWSFNIHPDVDVFLPLKFQVHSDCDINLRQKTAAFDKNNNVVLWNAWIGKKFLKNDALLIKAAVNDLLNQNIGFNRQVNSNFITQNTYSTIRRYLMFSVVWNFTKAGITAPPQR